MKKLLLLLIPFASFGQVKISDMPAATSLSGTELVPIVQSGVNKKATVSLWNTEYSNYYKVTTISALQTYLAGLGSGVDVNIFFPYGTYTVTSNITISNKGRVNVVGEGSILVGNFASLGTIIDVDNVTSLNVSNLNIDFNFSSINVQGIYARNITDPCIFDKLNVYNYGFATQSGIRLLNAPEAYLGSNKNNTPGATITSCNFYNALNYLSVINYSTSTLRGYGVYFENTAEYAKISDCTFSGLGVGVRITSGANSVISNCHFTSCLSRISGQDYGALWIQSGGTNSGKIIVTGCTFNHNWGYCIFNEVSNARRPMEVLGCHFIANAITPIYIQNLSSYNRIANNNFDRANEHVGATGDPYSALTTHYILINAASYNIVENNTFMVGVSASGRAITTTGASDNNIIRNNNYESGLTFTQLAGTADLVISNERKTTFQPDATVAGLNFGSVSADPSTLVNGDAFYNTTANQLEGRINGATRNFVFDDYAQTLTNKMLGTGTAIALGSDATGDLYANSAGSLVRIGAGTSTHVLTSNGAGTLPTWQASPDSWLLASGGALTADNTISGAFNVGFTNTQIGLGIAPASIGANIRVQAQGSNDLSTSFAFATTNNSGNVLHRTTNNGQFQFGNNVSKPYIGAASGVSFDNTGNGLFFNSPAINTAFVFNAASMSAGGQSYLRFNGTIANNGTNATFLSYMVPAITHTGNADISGYVLHSTLNFNSYSGTYKGFRNLSTFSPNAGTSTYIAFRNDFDINTTGGYLGTLIGYDHAPTLTSTTGLTHLAWRNTSGSIVMGHTGLTTSTTRAQIRGTGTGSDDILLLENSSGTSRFEVQGNGTVLFSGSAGTSGQVLTSAGASSPPTWSTALTDPMTTRGDVIIRNAANTTARLGIGAAGTFLSSDGTDVSWATPSGSGTYYAPNTLVANATDANFTATANGVHNILAGVATANRVITIPAGSNGDVMKFYNTENGFVWSFTGANVYLADRVTLVTELLYNVPCHMEKIDGLWIITN